MPIQSYVSRFRTGSIIAVIMGICHLGLPSISQAISNTGFETGTFSGWATRGNASIQTAAFGSGPTEGTYQAFLSTGGSVASEKKLEKFLGLVPGTLDATVIGNATSGSAMQQTFSANAGDTLSFDWNFLTNDGPAGGWSASFNDSAFYTLNGQAYWLADTLGVFGSSPTSFLAETGFQTVMLTLPTTGWYTLSFGVIDVSDTAVDSGFLVDNISTNSSIPTPEGSTLVLFGSGLVGIAAWKAWKQNHSRKHPPHGI